MRRKVSQVLNEGKARRWDDLSTTARTVILGTAFAGVLTLLARVLEAAIRGHW